MSDEQNIEEQEEQFDDEEEKSLYEALGLDKEDEDEYSELAEEEDRKQAKEDKLEKKLSAKVENLQKKFETTLLRERINKFEETSDEVEKDLFRTVAVDIKTLEDFDKAVNVVKKQAASLRKTVEDYKKKLEEKAEEEVSNAWGVGPVGTPQKKTPDEEEEMMKKIYEGDEHAAFLAIVGDDFPH